MSDRIRELLQEYRAGEVDEEYVIQRLVRQPYERHLLGRFDAHREARIGIPEVVLAEGKTAEEVVDIFETYLEEERNLIATRIDDAVVKEIGLDTEGIHYFETARILSTFRPDPDDSWHNVLVVSAGSSDRRVALEATITAELLGNPTDTLFDVGVAGLTRLSANLDQLDRGGIIIVVAGMDGALPSIIGGLAPQPVIAVPTSVGYGAHFDGVAPLLTMLNSCSPGTAVVNIDNGFGAGVLATKINRLLAQSS